MSIGNPDSAPPSEFTIALVGVRVGQRAIIEGLCRFSRRRGRSYRIVEGASHTADIAIIDVRSTEARAGSGLKQRHRAVVHLTSEASRAGGRAHSIRSFELAGRLIGLLDRVTDELDAGGPPASGDGGRALVVDDSLSVRTHMQRCLADLDLEVELAANAEAGMRKALDGAFDIIFLDVVLPETDGYQVCKQLKRHAELRDTPVVMLSGKGSRYSKVRGAMAGCDHYLTKPAAASELAVVVARYLGNNIQT